MKNFIIFLYFVFLFKLTIAESLPNMPGLESIPSVDDSVMQVPALDEEEDLSANPVEEENIPTINLPKNNEVTKLPASQIRQGKVANIVPQNNTEKIVDPFPATDGEEANRPVFDELKPENENVNNAQNVAGKDLEKIEKSEDFPETPDLNFGGKKIVKKADEKELSAAEKEKQVDDLLNSVIGEEEEENISAEDLLDTGKQKSPEVVSGSDLESAEPVETVKEEIISTPEDFSNVRRRVSYAPSSYTEEQLVDQLVKAAMRGDKQTVVALLHSGRKANAANRFGETPLMAAIYGGHADIVEILVAEGASSNAIDSKGNTPLHVAVAKRDYMAVQQLLRSGANPDVKNVSGDTPLLIATLNNSLDIVDLLVREGADVNKGNNDGLVPLHIATYNNNIEVVKYLLYVGANANIVNRDGLKPYDLAYGKNLDIARLLLSYTGPQRYTSSDLQQVIHQRNLPVASPVQPTQNVDQFSMFPQTYVEAEQKAIEQEEKVQPQSNWWAAKNEVSQFSAPQSIPQPASMVNKNQQISQSVQQEQSQAQPPSISVPEMSTIAPQSKGGVSKEISLDANDIKQEPQKPASMKINNVKSKSNDPAMGSLMSPSQALMTLSGGTIKYSDMTPIEQKSWDQKLEKWIRLGEAIKDLDPDKLARFKKLGKVLESIYQQQLGMHVEKIKSKIAYENYSMAVYGERRRPANPDKMNLKNLMNSKNAISQNSSKVDNYLKSIYASTPEDIVIEY